MYLFAGAKRKADVDLLKGEQRHDVAGEAILDKTRSQVQTTKAVIVTPPSNTNSRARWTNPNAPKPSRNLSHPRGFPWSTVSDTITCELANLLVDRFLHAIKWATLINGNIRWLMEHPQNLGQTSKREDPAT
eukprot:620270-Karenia_brevis.AAC.1